MPVVACKEMKVKGHHQRSISGGLTDTGSGHHAEVEALLALDVTLVPSEGVPADLRLRVTAIDRLIALIHVWWHRTATVTPVWVCRLMAQGGDSHTRLGLPSDGTGRRQSHPPGSAN